MRNVKTGGFASPPHDGFALNWVALCKTPPAGGKLAPHNGRQNATQFDAPTPCPSLSPRLLPTDPLRATPEPPWMNTFKPFMSDLGGTLNQLQQRANEVMSLTRLVQEALPEPERQHVLAAAWHDDTLVITTDSAAWTAQIRFAQDELRRHLAAHGQKTFIQLKVRVGNASQAG